jgi:hypothetical protein
VGILRQNRRRPQKGLPFSISPRVAYNNFVQDAHLYEAICLGPNIEKHASSPLYYEGQTHPHPDYNHLSLLKITSISKELKLLRKKIYAKHAAIIEQQHKHWLDFVKVADIEGYCPHKIAFEKILQKDLATPNEAMMYNFCKHSIFAAAKRQMKAAPKPDPKVADDFIKFAKSILDSTCPEHLRNPQLTEELKNFKYSFQQWFAHNPAKKQYDIEKYLQTLQGTSHLTDKEIDYYNSTTYSGICKQEIQEENGKSRMVCSIPIKTKVTMGPVTWKLEEIMAKHFPGYCGNKNLQQMTDNINKILADGFTKIVEGDGSAFDNTQDVTLKEVDRYLYQMIEDKVYHVPKEQFHEVSQQLYKTMKVEYIGQDKKKHTLFTYKILGSVFSGDCDTTLCNTMRMALYNIYVNEKAGLKYGKDYVLFSKGDDFTVFYKPYILDSQIQQAYYKYFVKAQENDVAPVFGLGQVLKFLSIGDPNTISFCSLRALYTNESEDKIILVRDFNKFLKIAKYSRKIKQLQGIRRINYLEQQATALLTSYPGIKIFENMAYAYRNEARVYANYLTHNDKRKAHEMIVKARYLTVKIFSEARKNMTQYVQIHEEKENKILYDIGYKKDAFKIHDGKSYWEMMKYLQEKSWYQLDKRELEYINTQIDLEITTEEFKATLGLKNEFDKELY